MENRENFGSRLGFILVSAGCAIGIGNVWKFPFIAGQCGGSVFVLFYLLFLVLIGLPIMTMELAVGRATRQSAVKSYKMLEKNGQKWHIHGWICVIGNYLLMMYYTTVAGWMLAYFFDFAAGKFSASEKIDTSAAFDLMLASPGKMAFYMAITVILGFAVLSFGVQKGLERINKIMMSGLLLLIIVLAFNSFTLRNVGEGLRFYLLPDLDKVKEVGIGNVIVQAMNQAFFTLSIGIAAIEIFGSYMSNEYTLLGEAAKICALDTFVALISGFIIFPACFSFGVEPGQGPSLIFVTLPKVFANMYGGRVWGALFFLFMTFASFSTVTAVFENLVAAWIDNLGMSRKKAVVINLVLMLVLSMPCVLGYNVWSHIHPIGDKNILDAEDFIVSNLLLPIGGLIYLVFCTSRFGWGFKNYIAEANKGKGIKLNEKLKPYFNYVMPVLIIIIFIRGLIR
ncbi:MAG: sodium-dependent transporter [Firmicutes bacterium]|nr:sodium-dependent transporter [Bacillota bacterium]